VQARATFRQRLELRINHFGCAEYVDGHHGIYHRLVTAVVNLQHHIRAESLDRIEQDGAAVWIPKLPAP
jgi:hypothetical protein